MKIYYNILITLVIIFSCDNKKGLSKESSLSKINIETGINVAVTTIDKTTFNKQIIANGKVEVLQKNKLRFKTNNIISKLNIFNGKKVVKGEIIASLENDLRGNQLQKARITLNKAKNNLEKEKINYGEENITANILNRLSIKSGVLEAENNLKRVKIEYNQTILRAPFSGVIANLEKKKGDYINSSEILCTIINTNTIEVSFSVLENEYYFISKNQEIEIQSFFNKDDKFRGIITEINPLVDKNGLIKLKARIASSKTNLLDGMNVRVIVSKPLKDIIVIPKKALILRKNRNIVFTLEKGLAKWNYVEVIEENSNSYVVQKGVKLNDTIIVSGNLNLSHDAKVNATFTNDIETIRD